MIAYKLVRQMGDGTLSSLFINKKERLPIGEWMISENHPTSGFAVRKPVVVRAGLPRFMVEGDRSTASLMVSNRSKKHLEG